MPVNLNFQTNRGWTAATLVPQTPTNDLTASTGSALTAPSFLQDALNRLVQAQATGVGGGARNNPSQALVDQILSDPNGYLLAPALAAQSGGGSGLTNVSLAPIQNPAFG